MSKIVLNYNGDLRCSCEHVRSGTSIVTDAPVDNNGKGESFSPTDLLATAYVSCMMTIVGIYCDNNNLKFKQGKGEVEKIMFSNPRRIGRLNIKLDFSNNDWSESQRKKIEQVAKACPVAKSVSGEIDIDVNFQY